MGVAELIVYATPNGPLAEAVDRYSTKLAARPTTAQQFPPHCTLTGFFHDRRDAIARYVDAARQVVRPVAVDVVALHSGDEWIGLELASPELQRLTADFAALVADAGTRTDEIRPKDWLHLSLAYGHAAADTAELAALATDLVDPAAPAGWDLRVYERRDGEWIAHGSWPLPATGRA